MVNSNSTATASKVDAKEPAQIVIVRRQIFLVAYRIDVARLIFFV